MKLEVFIQNFLNSSKYNSNAVQLKKIICDDEKNKIKIVLGINSIISIDSLFELKNEIINSFFSMYTVGCEIVFDFDNYNLDILKIVSNFLENEFKKNGLSTSKLEVLSDPLSSKGHFKFIINYENKTSNDFKNFIKTIETKLENFKIEVKFVEIKSPLIDAKDSIQKDESLDYKESYSNIVEEIKPKVSFINKISDIPIDSFRLEEITDPNYNRGKISCEIEGQVFLLNSEEKKVEIRDNKWGTSTEYILYDDNDAIYVRHYRLKEDDIAFYENVFRGTYLKIVGNIEVAKNGEVYVSPKSIIILTDRISDIKEDKSETKRIEFHLHTKSSNQDAITEIGEYVDRAVKYGHKAIALTDFDCCYSYHKFFTAVKNYNKEKKVIKPIYGVELSYVNENNGRIVPKLYNDVLIKKETFVIFDFETTGLYANYDSIIQIGAIKITYDEEIAKFEEYINPNQKISEGSKRTINIDDSFLEDKKKVEEVIGPFLKFIEGTTLVGHNVMFDLGFLDSIVNKLNLSYQINGVIDTIAIARCIEDDKKRFNLEVLTSKLKTQGDDSNYHNAMYDSMMTVRLFRKYLGLFDESIVKLSDLEKLNTEPYKITYLNHINLLASNKIGYKNIFRIVSDALTTHFFTTPRALRKVILENREGILIGSSCSHGEVFTAALSKTDEEIISIMKDYDYIEVQPPISYLQLYSSFEDGEKVIKDVISRIINLAKKANKLVIATGDVHYIDKYMKRYREFLIRVPMVGQGKHNLANATTTPTQYFMTTDEMLKEFDFLDDKLREEIVITNPNLLNDKIEYFEGFTNKLYDFADDFMASNGIPSVEEEIKKIVDINLTKKYGLNVHPYIKERLDMELSKILGNKFGSNYFLAHLIVKKSLEEGYLVGSRGSVGSSFVATMLNITEVNPLPPHYVCHSCGFTLIKLNKDELEKYPLKESEIKLYSNFDNVLSGYDLKELECPICKKQLYRDGQDIPFETFLGYKGDKTPDIDLNFSKLIREKVVSYLTDIIGEENTFRAGTQSTLQSKKAFGYVSGYYTSLGIEVRKASIVRQAAMIEEVRISTGQHPGGVVVVPKHIDILDVTPYQYPANNLNEKKTTHFEYHDFEDNLLKLDILGHDDPTVIKYLMDYVRIHPDEFMFSTPEDIPITDEKTLRLFSSVESLGLSSEELLETVGTNGVPEFGTDFVKGMLSDIRPKTFSQIVQVSGLSHGTDVWLNNAKDLLLGKIEDYGNISFSNLISCRDDIMRQLIEYGLPKELSFEIMEFVRKGKPAKEKARWQSYEEIMRGYNIPEWYIYNASRIKYMFPKAHAVAYVLNGLRIAWFKVNKPLVYYSAMFSIRCFQFDYLLMTGNANLIRDAISSFRNKSNPNEKDKDTYFTNQIALEFTLRGYKFLPISINKSEAVNFVIEDNSLRMSFITLEGLGSSAAINIIEERNIRPFTSKEDVKKRTKINSTVFLMLEKIGAFDCLKDLEVSSKIEETLF
ncbi:MAG: PolC-type DNA polymerase III [Acholeplasmatales bacterium]|jgi:DNA polymerase-3 subunit alpha (Gram-positive type)|nr:PolC-type DNA polymerase III [Acholeplasmatales bacterium]